MGLARIGIASLARHPSVSLLALLRLQDAREKRKKEKEKQGEGGHISDRKKRRGGREKDRIEGVTTELCFVLDFKKRREEGKRRKEKRSIKRKEAKQECAISKGWERRAERAAFVSKKAIRTRKS